MRAAVFHGEADIRLEEVPDPRPVEGEVVVAVEAAGICGSDLHRYRGLDPWSSGSSSTPYRAGHEIAGVVRQLGRGVDGLQVGQRVAVEPMQLAGCGSCPECRRGSRNVCQQRQAARKRWASAGFAELDRVAVDHVFPVPDTVPLELAALTDVYACAVHAVHRVPLRPTDTVVVIGTGPLGLAIGQVSRLSGVEKTILVGRRRAALESALTAGAADSVVELETADNADELLDEHLAHTGARVVFEAVGGPTSGTLELAVRCAAANGVVGVVGAFDGNVEVPYRLANRKEITLRWCNGYADWHGRSEFQIALEWIGDGRVNASELISHRFPLAAISAAFRTAADKGRTNAIKVIVKPGER